MNSGEHVPADDPEDIDRALRAAFALHDDGVRRFAEDGFHEHLMRRMIAGTQARRRRQRGVLMVVGFLSALGAASLAHSALSSVFGEMSALLADAGFAVTEGIGAKSPVFAFVGLFVGCLLLDRMSEDYA